MRENITRDFNGAEEKGLKIFYDENLGNFDIDAGCEIISFYDEANEEGDASDGTAKIKVQKFIEEY